MKSKIIIALIVLIPFCAFSQKKKSWNKPLYDAKPFHFGFTFNGGMLDFAVSHASDFGAINPDGTYVFDSVMTVEGIAQPLLGAGVVGVMKINDYFDLRFSPGLSFGQRNIEYVMIPENSSLDTLQSHTMKIESALIQFPLHLKYRAERESNYKPYILIGMNYTLDLAANKKIKDEEKPKIRLKNSDILAEVGFGIDYYLQYFKLSTELRFSYGLTNIVVYDGLEQTRVFKRLGTKMVTFAIFFE